MFYWLSIRYDVCWISGVWCCSFGCPGVWLMLAFCSPSWSSCYRRLSQSSPPFPCQPSAPMESSREVSQFRIKYPFGSHEWRNITWDCLKPYTGIFSVALKWDTLGLFIFLLLKWMCLSAFVSALGSHEMGCHKVCIIYLLIFMMVTVLSFTYLYQCQWC